MIQSDHFGPPNCQHLAQEIIPKSQSDIPGCCAPRTQGEDAKCKSLGDQRKAWEEYDLCTLADKTWCDTKIIPHVARTWESLVFKYTTYMYWRLRRMNKISLLDDHGLFDYIMWLVRSKGSGGSSLLEQLSMEEEVVFNKLFSLLKLVFKIGWCCRFNASIAMPPVYLPPLFWGYDSAEPQWETTKAEELANEPTLQAQMRSILRMSLA